MTRSLPQAAAVLAALLVGGAALGQVQVPSPTPTPASTPPAQPAPAPTPPPEATPAPAPPAEVTPAPAPPGDVAPASKPPAEVAPAPTPTAEVTPAPRPTAVPEVAPPGATAPPAAPATATPPAAAVPAAPAAPPAATAVPAARVTDAPLVAILQAPADNPFGKAVEVAAALPPKLTFDEAVANSSAFYSARVDPTGRVMGVRPQRDPIPSLAGESQRSLSRWVFDPARKGSDNVETWAAMRLDLEVEVDAPRSVQSTLTTVTPATPVPRPLAWIPDDAWVASRKGAAPDGGVPIESVDSPPMPKKTPWDAKTYRGPFNARFWVKVNSAGVVEKAVPLEASDPILLPYLRRTMSTWAFRPARVNGAPADSWNELDLSGTVVYRVELKQIASLRRSLFGS
jgi:hypothetical protein